MSRLYTPASLNETQIDTKHSRLHHVLSIGYEANLNSNITKNIDCNQTSHTNNTNDTVQTFHRMITKSGNIGSVVESLLGTPIQFSTAGKVGKNKDDKKKKAEEEKKDGPSVRGIG